MSVTYLPVYSLGEQTAPTTSDYLVVQSAETDGDVGLLSILSFVDTFIQTYLSDDTIELVDGTVTTLYESMWWSL